MARPEDRLAAIRAHEKGRLGVSWGSHRQSPFRWREFAKRQGWPLPLFFGAKEAFIAKMLQNDENFEQVVMHSGGIDVWIDDEQE